MEDEDKKPAAKVILSVETDDLMEGKGIVFFLFSCDLRYCFLALMKTILVFSKKPR
jgi:hypothetical protein